MPARFGDAAAEDQPSARVVEQRVAGRLDAETPGLNAVHITDDGHAGNVSGAAPQIGLFTFVGRACGERKEHIRGQPPRTLRHEPGQFAKAGPRAGAARVRDHHERGVVRIPLNPAGRWSVPRGFTDCAGSAGILEQRPPTGAEGEDPHQPQHNDRVVLERDAGGREIHTGRSSSSTCSGRFWKLRKQTGFPLT